MFKELLMLWNDNEKQGIIGDSLDHFSKMLDLDKDLYIQVTDALFLGGDLTNLKDDVYSKDREINKLEQLIRRKVITALATDASSANITASLILMSVIKDAERIGDYAKNIFDVFNETSQLDKGPNYEALLEIRNKIMASFNDVKSAFAKSDTALARKLLNSISETKDLCDATVKNMLNDQKQDDSVAYALLSRFFKRTLGHLSNIVTSIIMPIDKLDYFDKDKL
jgi:phosphate transport system protein